MTGVSCQQAQPLGEADAEGLLVVDRRRLLQQIEGAEREGSKGIGLARLCGEHQDRRGPRRHDRRDPGESIGAGHLQIHGDHIGRQFERTRRRLAAIACGADDDAAGLRCEGIGEPGPDQRRVVHHQDADRLQDGLPHRRSTIRASLVESSFALPR